jgi:hypothetical protein
MKSVFGYFLSTCFINALYAFANRAMSLSIVIYSSLNSGSFNKSFGRRLPCNVLTSSTNCFKRGDLKENSSH